MPAQQPYVDNSHAGTFATVVVDALDTAGGTLPLPTTTVVTQLEPAESRFSIKEPAQQPCREDKHNATACVFVVLLIALVVAIGVLTSILLALIIGMVVIAVVLAPLITVLAMVLLEARNPAVTAVSLVAVVAADVALVAVVMTVVMIVVVIAIDVAGALVVAGGTTVLMVVACEVTALVAVTTVALRGAMILVALVAAVGALVAAGGAVVAVALGVEVGAATLVVKVVLIVPETGLVMALVVATTHLPRVPDTTQVPNSLSAQSKHAHALQKLNCLRLATGEDAQQSPPSHEQKALLLSSSQKPNTVCRWCHLHIS